MNRSVRYRSFRFLFTLRRVTDSSTQPICEPELIRTPAAAGCKQTALGCGQISPTPSTLSRAQADRGRCPPGSAAQALESWCILVQQEQPIDPPGADPDTLSAQALRLLAVGGGVFREDDPAPCTQHPVPGNIQILWRALERQPGQSRSARQASGAGHGAIGRHVASRYRTHYIQDQLNGCALGEGTSSPGGGPHSFLGQQRSGFVYGSRQRATSLCQRSLPDWPDVPSQMPSQARP
jgi:hypothetical protein